MGATVLVTGMGSNTGIGVAKALRRQAQLPVRIVGTDLHPPGSIAGRAFCDRLVQVPAAREPGYVEAIAALCRSEGVDVVFPIVDAEVEALAAAREGLRAAGAFLWASQVEAVRTCNDKRAASVFLRRHGFRVPESWAPAEASARPEALPYPVVVKPARGVGSHGVAVVRGPAGLAAAVAATADPVVERFVEGPEFTVDYLADAEGRPLACVPRERLETKAGISTKGVTVRDESLAAEATRLAVAIGIRGPANLQCRRDAEGFVFFDVNPRFSGALPLTVAAGVNGPLVLTKLALGLPVAPEELQWRGGVLMARYWEEVFSLP